MQLQIELDGKPTPVKSMEIFQYALDGVISPKTRLWVDGKETTCDNIKGIRFASDAPATEPTNDAQAEPSSAPSLYGAVYNEESAPDAVAATPAPTFAPTPNGATSGIPRDLNDPRVVHTPYLHYFIGGGAVPYVLCYLEPGRSVFSSAGGRVWFKGDVHTDNNTKGGLLKSLGRLVSGETLFMSTYTAKTESEVAFATHLPGAIVPRVLAANESIVCQRGAFLAASPGVSIQIFFQKKIGSGLFGGEGFVMQKITGPGVVFLELDGSAVEYELQPGERMTCDTGALAWMDATCSIDVVMVQGLKNIFFGGEGLFDTIVTGPGKATFQTTNIHQFASMLAPYVSKGS